MNKQEVLDLLEEHQNERGIENWKKLTKEKQGSLQSFGIGLTQLRKLAKQIGRDHDLATQLFKTKNYDAKIIGLLIGEPKKLTRAQVEQQVDKLEGGYLAHVFSSCDATLSKAPFAFEIACEWLESEDPVRRRCAYGLLYELSKKKKVAGMTDDFLLDRITDIEETIHQEEMWVRESMLSAMLGIGKRSKLLNKAAVKAMKKIGPVDIDYGDDNACEPLDVMKHLTSPYIREKLGA